LAQVNRRNFVIGAGATVGAMTAGSRPLRAQSGTVRFASVGGATDAPLFLADELGLFKEANIKLDYQRMSSAPNLITALATGQIEVAGISITPGMFTAAQQNIRLKIVGDKQSLRPGVSVTRLIIRSDLAKGTEAENVQALRGKTVAVSAKASSVYMLLEDLLKKHKMTLSDIKPVDLAYPNMLPAFTTKAIDAAIHLEPFLSQTISRGIAKQVADLTEFVPKEGGTIVPLVYSEKFGDNKVAANDFMLCYMKGVRIYNDAMFKNKDRDKVIEIVARGARVDAEVIRSGFPAGLDPNQRVSVDFIKRLQEFFIAQGFMRSGVEAAQYIDLSYADAALKKLGEYKV
jgi:NitT/TauT family transport system substrate-binding protein